MLFVLTGTSCSGKTEIAEHLRDVITVFDFDEHGVPELPSTEWRQRTLEGWVQVALEHQVHGRDVLLAAPTPFGEVLASPSADRLDGIAALLVDVDDWERIARLERRSPAALYSDGGAGILRWAAWHRRHARNPRYQQNQLTTEAWSAMRWERWTGMPSRSWSVGVLDTTEMTVAAAAEDVREWIAREREAAASDS